MARTPALFTKADVTRATRGVLAAGVPVQRVLVAPDGTIVVIAGEPETAGAPDNDYLDKWMASRAGQA